MHKEDKCQNGMKTVKLHKVKKGGNNINKAYHAFLCALTREYPDNFFFSEDNGLVGKGSDGDAVNEKYDVHKKEDSNTSGWRDRMSWVSNILTILCLLLMISFSLFSS